MALSPMMEQYIKTKEEYKDCILLYRLGDFYEMFFEDALTASKVLDITLTGKDCGLKERAPMCGVPYHAVDTYIQKLISEGYKVAIGEQVSDPKTSKGLVEREVIRVITPGTVLDPNSLDESRNNYLMCIVCMQNIFGCAVADVTTGDCYVTEIDREQKLLDEICKYAPAEIVCNESFRLSGIDLEDLEHRQGIALYSLEDWYFDEERCRELLLDHFHVASLEGLGLQDYDSGMIAVGALFQYLTETQKRDLCHMTSLHPYLADRYMMIDSSSRRNLELVETMREKRKRGSLLWVLDKKKTAMGARMLRQYVEQPLIDPDEIEKRLDAVEDFNNQAMLRDEICEYLSPVYDLERIISRVSYHTANPRDLISFSSSLSMLPHIRRLLADFHAPLLKELYEELDTLEDLCLLITSAIVDDPPLAMKEGGIIRDGYNEDVDRYRRSQTEGKQWLSELEEEERERTGIKNLKVKYNRVFGYYLEVSNSFKDLIPEDYTRKQTLANAERFITPRLKELEDLILGAEDKLKGLEYDLFVDVRDRIEEQVARIQKTAKAVAAIDVLSSLSVVAQRNHYVRPKLNTNGTISIKEGRHPVVELMLPNEMFIPNDTYLDSQDKRISIITGPNMAGKSTYMRQSALIVLMAQIGSFVPAKEADIGIVDRIFTRVGASDDLASGQSTFMVEMTEVANILRNATADSLLILDEIGRGTSTFDGLSIAWAVIEYINNQDLIGAKTLFATHYHELTELEGKLPGVHNYCIAVKEQGDDIVFLRKIVKGGADKSYGIQVAKLAGVPEAVITRAKELVEQLGQADIAATVKDIAVSSELPAGSNQLEQEQISLFDSVLNDDIIKELQEADISNMTPMEAMNFLYQLQSKINNRW